MSFFYNVVSLYTLVKTVLMPMSSLNLFICTFISNLSRPKTIPYLSKDWYGNLRPKTAIKV